MYNYKTNKLITMYLKNKDTILIKLDTNAEYISELEV